MTGPTLDLHLKGDLANILASLDLAGRNFGGEYGRGWSAALAAMGVAIGIIPETDARFTFQIASPPTAPSSWAGAQLASVEDDYGPGAFSAFK